MSEPYFPSWNVDDLRTRFTYALSDMYRAEVPLYGELVNIVHEVDNSVLAKQERHSSDLEVRHQLERHGAIRLGTEHELRMIRRLFALFGMYPVGYYDLSIVKFPLHGTAFRPVNKESLSKNPFRVFTTVLRENLLSGTTREKAKALLSKRNLFTERLCEIIDRAETDNIMTGGDSEDLISEALKIFKWHSRSPVAIDDYLRLKEEHPMVADIVCFPSAHINHLTPRTLDIDLVQEEMVRRGLPAKESIEGPPRRECPILLRQTSFKALSERVDFVDPDGNAVAGTHTARFGEVEQRGAAVTRQGRDLYDQLLASVTNGALDNTSHNRHRLSAIFQNSYPDTWEELRAHKLVYFRYEVTAGGKEAVSKDLLATDKLDMEHLISRGLIGYEPITYEDFLPFSAAGIFKSNLVDQPAEKAPAEDVNDGFSELEEALGCKITSEFVLYEEMQRKSIDDCREVLGLKEIVVE